jgi:hypothetical protein
MQSHIKLGKYLLNGVAYTDKMKELYRTQLPDGGLIDLHLVITREDGASFGKVGYEEACEILDSLPEMTKNIPRAEKRRIISEYQDMVKEFEKEKSKMEEEGFAVFEPPIHEEKSPVKLMVTGDPAFQSCPDLNAYMDAFVIPEAQRGATEIFVEYGYNKEKLVGSLMSWTNCCLKSKEYCDSSVVIVPLDYSSPTIIRISRCEWVSYAVLIKKGDEVGLQAKLREKLDM